MTEPVSIDRYTGFESIGSGGFSRVYRAWRADQDRFVAVKVLALGSDREIDRDAFVAECRAMGAVSNHPNVVTAFDNGFTNEGYPFIAMELCPESLTDRMKAAPGQRLDVVEVLSIGAQIFAALERAHDKGILHRDLKPQNILFTEFDQPALTDFGIAALAGDAKSQENWALSRHYAAPEVINEAPYTVACDIYSLGATMYTALAGRRPFSRRGDNEAERLEQRIRTESPPPLDPDWVPPIVADEIMLLLAKHPRDRPRSAGEAAKRLMKLQERLGHTPAALGRLDTSDRDVTEVRAPDGTVSDIAESDFTTSDLTSVRPAGPAPAPIPVRAPARNQRPLLAIGVLAAVIIAGVLGVLAMRDSNTTEDPVVRAPTEVPVAPEDAEVVDASAPSPPTEVRVVDIDDALRVSWTAADQAARYRVDVANLDVSPTITSETQVELERAGDETLCVTVLSIGENGRLSRASEQVCG